MTKWDEEDEIEFVDYNREGRSNLISRNYTQKKATLDTLLLLVTFIGVITFIACVTVAAHYHINLQG